MSEYQGPATDRQLAYLRKLVDQSGGEIHAYLVDHGVTKLAK